MPRIPNGLVDTVFYVYPDVESAWRGKTAGGSGFIVGVRNPPGAGHWLYAVTNRHVVDKSGQSLVFRLNVDVEGGMSILRILGPINRENWFFHDELDDVAVLPISLAPFRVKPRGEPGWHIVRPEECDTPAKYRYTYIAEEDFLTKELIDKLDIGPGEEVFTMGRFVSHEGREQNRPALRFGNISMMPGDPIEQEGSGFKQESFVVECRSIAGFSGSPVFVSIPPFSYRPRTRSEAGTTWQGPWFLGVDWGHLTIPEPVVDPGGKTHQDDLRVHSNSGMMGVVPAWKLTELLYQDNVVKHRREALQRFTQVADESTASDSEATGDPGARNCAEEDRRERDRRLDPWHGL